MSLLRRRPRRHHQDPEIERELERIRSLQRRAASLEEQSRQEIGALRRLHQLQRANIEKVADGLGHASLAVAATEKGIAGQQEQIRRLGLEVDQVHDEIAKREGAMSPSDLAYLQ